MTGPSFAPCALALGIVGWIPNSSVGLPLREHFGAPLACFSDLRGPQDAAFARDGGLWVAETLRHRVVVFDAQGARRAAIGTRGTQRAQFLRPAGIACAPDGRVFVSDTGNHRVQVFAADGTWLDMFGARGRAQGELCEPRGLCLDGQRLLVADSGNARIAVFDLAGAPRAPLEDGGSLLRPVDVACDPLARVYVLDALACRVVRLDPLGAAALQVGARGAPFGLFADPQGLAFLGPRIFVSDRFNHRVQEFDPAGTFVGSFPGPAYAPHAGAGTLFAPAGLAAASDGARLAVCEPLEDRVQIFGAAPDADEAASHADGSDEGASLARVGEGAASDGQIAVWVDPESRSIQVRRDGGVGLAPLTRLGARAGMGVDLEAPRDAAIDSERGWIHVSDRSRIWTFALGPGALERGFDPLAARLVRYLEFADTPAAGPLAELQWPFDPGALVVLPDGGLLAADERNRALVRLDRDGRVDAAWTEFAGEGLGCPVDLARAGERLYVSDADRARVLVLDLSGVLLAQLAHAGPEPLGTPSGVLPLDDGRVLVADRERDRVHVFGADGERVALWGASGMGPGELHQPTALFGATEGRLRLIDCGNRRGQVLSTDGRFVLSF